MICRILLFVLLALGLPLRVAQAQTGSVALGLDGLGKALPSHVCVIYDRPNRAMKPPSDSAVALAKLKTALDASPPGPEALNDVRDAFQAIGAAAGCGAESETCKRAPSVDQLIAEHRERWMQCARNGLSEARTGRVLYLQLTMPAAVRSELLSIYLQGAQVSLVASPPISEGATITSLGGDYERQSSTTVRRSQAVLALAPSCEDRDLSLPQVANPDDMSLTIELSIGEVTKFHCRRRMQNPIRVRVPARTTSGQLKRLRVAVRDSDGHDDDRVPESMAGPRPRRRTPQLPAVAWTGSVDWLGDTVPADLPLQATSIRFRWAADPCLYVIATVDDCPEVRSTTGIECEAVELDEDNQCVYTCPNRKGERLPSPFEVLFHVGLQRDAWRSVVSGPDQVLSDYADRDERQFRVDLEAWQGTEWHPLDDQANVSESRRVGITGDHVQYVEILSPNGSIHRVVPADNQRVSVPGAVCGDVLQYRIAGTRTYEAGYVKLEDGRIRIPSPSETVQTLKWGGYLGGGVVYDSYFDMLRPVGLAQLSARINPTGMWRATDVGFEVQGMFALSNHSYRGLSSSDVPRQNATEDIQIDEDRVQEIYMRFLFAAAMDVAITDALRFGLATGAGLGAPFFDKYERQFGGLSALFMQALYIRYEVDPHFSFEAAGRVIGPQSVMFHRFNPAGAPERIEEHTWLFGGDLGGRFWL